MGQDLRAALLTVTHEVTVEILNEAIVTERLVGHSKIHF